jgi:hypothetical protein
MTLNANQQFYKDMELIYESSNGDKRVSMNTTNTGGIGMLFEKGLLTTPIKTILDTDGFDYDADGVAEQVSWDNIYNLKQATTALRLPATTNILVLDDTLECNDDNLAKTRTAVLSAPPSVPPTLVLTDITNAKVASVSTTQIQVIDNDPAYLNPPTTTITTTSINVTAGINELDTTITNQSIQVRFNGDLYSNLVPSNISFLDNTATGVSSSLTASTLQLTESSGNLDANLTNSALTFFNGNSGNTYSLGINGSDLVIDAGGDRLLLNSNVAESYWGDYIAGTNANIALNIAGACRADIDIRAGEFNVGDLNSAGNNTKIVINDTNPSIALQTTGGSIEVDSGAGITTIGDVQGVNNGTKIIVDDNIPIISLLSSDIEVDSGTGITKIGDVQGSNNGTKIELNDTNQTILLISGTGVKLSLSTIIYAVSYFTTNQTFNNTSRYSNTFNGASLVATLPVVSGTNVGTQYLITNTNASALSVAASGGQLIYSSTGTAINPSKNLIVGHSHIFTAIYTTSGSTFGWSMV